MNFIFFWKISEGGKKLPYGFLSQWYRSEFKIPKDEFELTNMVENPNHLDIYSDTDSINFNCAEQAMMFGKVILFSDWETASKILSTKSPKVQKDLGRQVSGYNDGVWSKLRYDWVVTVNCYKFIATDELRDKLIETKDMYLVEASPYDRVWGIGMGPDDPKIHQPDNWRGQNLLGKALMEVREIVDQY